MHVAIIGGGYAGLAAAVTLAEHSVPVTVFEAARNLGGRARGITINGLRLDNGQHLLLGAYHETLRLLRQVHGDTPLPLQRLPLRLCFPGHFDLTTPRLPAPLHLGIALATAKGLKLTESGGVIRFIYQLRKKRFHLHPDISVETLLHHHGQDGTAAHYLWRPLCLAALNTPPADASAQIFLNVLRDTLFANREASDLLLPQTDLTTLFPRPAAEFIHRHGGVVHTQRRVQAATASPAGGFQLTTVKGKQHFSHVICAVPPWHLTALTRELPLLRETAEQVATFRYQPCYTVYLQYPAAMTLPAPMTGLTNGWTQWLFDRDNSHHQTGLLAAVISGEGTHQMATHAELAQRVHDEINQALGGNLPPPQWHKVIGEHRATFACTVALRHPPAVTPLKHWLLAGDYTTSDYPATLEAAVRSGVSCARIVLGETSNQPAPHE